MDAKKFIEQIPPPDEIRRQIAEKLRETSVLRRLLKISIEKHGRGDGR
jgi:hypothetical protein